MIDTSKLITAKMKAAQAINDTQVAIENAIHNLLDTKAKLLRYADINSARGYAGYANFYQAEALTLANWSSECWAKAGVIEADVIAGKRTMPTVEQVLTEMPAYIGVVR